MKVVLVGDSIRIGYEPYVKKILKGRAKIVSSKENGGDSRNVLANAKKWIVSEKPDILHVNCGLHDIKREPGTDEHQVCIDEYISNLEEIFRMVKRSCKQTRIIWATTTPVIDEWHNSIKPFKRYEEDVDRYNISAYEVASEFKLKINDLYEVVNEHGPEEYLVEDGVHYKDEGYKMLGETVAQFIGKYCG